MVESADGFQIGQTLFGEDGKNPVVTQKREEIYGYYS
jgi:hypothetical protein